jgi:rare lipoprotein A
MVVETPTKYLKIPYLSADFLILKPMVISLGNERTAPLPGRYKTALTVAALVVMSAFATDNAPAAARPADAPVIHDVTSYEIVTTLPAPTRTRTRTPVLTRIKSGLASWYGTMLQGRFTASGHPFDMYAMTAAHRTLPFGSRVKVTDLRNRRSVVVTINDRGTLRPGREIDLSLGAAQELHMVNKGLDPVRLELLTYQN